jgi:hypothetical protein
MIGLSFILSGCDVGRCPEVACLPEVTLAYRQPVEAPYHLTVSLRGVVFEDDCPLVRPYPTIGIQSCSAEGLVVRGVDLGQGSNEVVYLTVSTQPGESVSVTAGLDRILNSRDCDQVCYQHSGSVPN